jgi:hypothetical protein
MAPKEKAKKLVDKFYPRATSYSLDGKNQNENAKQCALIAVKEMIKVLYSLKFGNALSDEIEYYEQVRQEIINL